MKRNSVKPLVHNTFGGFNRGAVTHLHDLAKRSIDCTAYESWTAPSFVPYWAQRISAAIVTADARRCLRRLPGLRRRAAPSLGLSPLEHTLTHALSCGLARCLVFTPHAPSAPERLVRLCPGAPLAAPPVGPAVACNSFTPKESEGPLGARSLHLMGA